VIAEVDAAVTRAFREEWGQIVATLIGLTGDRDLAEECAQDAFAQALQRWPRDGIPRRPGAWLTTTARNRVTDRLRREAVGVAKLRETAMLSAPDEPGDDAAAVSGIPDDRLRLMFTCCHPALAFELRVALTLRTLAGLTTAEIARAFLVSEDTMSKRLVRAKRKIRNAGIPFRIPPAHLLAERTASVLGVLYPLFNEGADLVRQNLTTEAIRLARILAQLLPRTSPRRAVCSRCYCCMMHGAPPGATRRGSWCPSRTRTVAAGMRARSRRACSCWRRHCGGDGPARTRSRPPSPPATRPRPRLLTRTWAQIAALYGQLSRLVLSVVVKLNRAVAVGMRDGPAAGLALVEQLEEAGELAGYHLLPATRADLLRRLGRTDEAAVAYREATELASTDPERHYLTRRLTETTGS
jgi:RNA polymerase sigma-70 factor, ECF subfamily